VTEIRDYPAGYGFDYQKLTFGYDDLDRLVSAKAEQGRPESNYDYTGGNGYSYNEIGNLVSKEGVGYTYPAPGQPHPHAVTTAGGSSYTYDNDGNMTSGAGRAITWDAENRPASITAGGQTTTFVYGPQGERVKVTVGTVTTVYVGDYYEKNLSTGVVTRYYTFGGQRVALRQGSTVYWIHADHLGSTAVVRDGEGNTVTRYYYPWGGLRPPVNGDARTQRLYTGQLLDASTGLYYYGARYYDPGLGRFIQADTLVPGPLDPQSFNRYSYVRNQPLRYVDPSGHWYYDPGCDCLVSQGVADSGHNDYPQYTDLEPQATPPVILQPDYDYPQAVEWANDYPAEATASRVAYSVYNSDPARYSAPEYRWLRQQAWEYYTLMAGHTDNPTCPLAEGDTPGSWILGGWVMLMASRYGILNRPNPYGGQGGAFLEPGVNANKVHHIFDAPVHNLGPFEAAYGGDRVAAYNAVYAEYAQVAPNYSSAELNAGITLNVNGFDIMVRGAIVSGIPRIGTFFIP
jgi:RHS repeat-associated protein